MGAIARQSVASTTCQLSFLAVEAAYSWFEPLTGRMTTDPDFALTAEDVSWVIAVIEIGCLVGSIVAGYLTDRVGRKYLVLSTGPVCFLGWFFFLFSKSFLTLCIIRLIHGFAIGVVYTVTPIYTAEISQPDVRGILSGTFQTMGFMGTLFVFSIGPYLSYINYAFACLPLPVLFIAALLFVPETPYYLLMTEREDEARKVLKWLRDSADVEEELINMKSAITKEMSEKSSWKALFYNKTELTSFVIVQIVSITRHWSGMIVMTSYALESFSRSESFLPPAEMSIILCVLIIVISVISSFMSDWIGRKSLLLFSCYGCFLGNLLTGSYYFLHEVTSINARPYVWLMYVGLIIYCICYDMGLGPLLQTLQAEMFGARTRGIAAAITHVLTAVLCFLAVKLYASMNEMVGLYMNFFIYSVVSLVGGVLLSLLMFETARMIIGQMTELPKK